MITGREMVVRCRQSGKGVEDMEGKVRREPAERFKGKKAGIAHCAGKPRPERQSDRHL